MLLIVTVMVTLILLFNQGIYPTTFPILIINNVSYYYNLKEINAIVTHIQVHKVLLLIVIKNVVEIQVKYVVDYMPIPFIILLQVIYYN